MSSAQPTIHGLATGLLRFYTSVTKSHHQMILSGKGIAWDWGLDRKSVR